MYISKPWARLDEHQSIRNRNIYPPSRSQHISIYGRQSLWMGGSFRANETILSWSLDGRLIPAPYQYVRNDGHTLSTETSLNIYSPFLCHDIHRQHDSGLIYQQTGWNIFSGSLRIGIGDFQSMPGTRHLKQSSPYPRQIQYLADRLSRLDRPVRTEWSLDQTVANSVFQMLKFPNVDLFATRFIHKLPLYVSPVPYSHALAVDAFSMNWNYLHAYAFPPTILIPSVLEKIRHYQCRIVLIAPFWPQQLWFSDFLKLLVSAPIRLPLFPTLLTQSKGRFLHQNLPVLDLHASELSNSQSEIKKNHKTLQILSRSQE